MSLEAITAIKRLLTTRRAGSLIPLSSPTEHIGAGTTSGSADVAIGFDFEFDGTVYSSTFHVRPFGFVRLAGTLTSASNANLFSSSTNVVLAPWYDGLRTAYSTGYVKSEVQGEAPFRRHVIEWKCNLVSTHTTTNNDVITFQLVLYETTNAFEFRYGPRVRMGSPTGTPSASMGFKGATNVDPNARRDLAPGVSSLELYGSIITTTTNLNTSSYDTLAGLIFRTEPNWPMSGRLFDIPPHEIPGLQDPWAEPIWKLANNLNTLWCQHAPPLIALAPYQPSPQTSLELVVPDVEPDPEVAEYELTVTVWATASETITVELFQRDVPDPQPTVPGDWLTIDALAQALTGSSWSTMTLDIVLPAGKTDYRLVVSAAANSVLVGGVILRPKVATTFDPTLVELVGLGQIRQLGAAVHPEIYNRIYRRTAEIVGARKQMLWSWAQGGVGKAPTITGYVVQPQVLHAMASCVLPPGWARQTTEVVVYAKASADGRAWSIGERGGSGVTFTVDLNGGEYRSQDDTLELLAGEPTILSTVTPTTSGTLDAMTAVIWWTPSMSTGDLFVGVTPAPSRAALGALVSRLARAAEAVAVAGYATKLWRESGRTQPVRILFAVPAGVTALRPKVVRVGNTTASSTDTSVFASASGAAPADEIVIPYPLEHGTNDELPLGGGTPTIVAGAEVWEPLPTGAMDRFLESPVSGWGAPALEVLEVAGGVGITLVPIREPLG